VTGFTRGFAGPTGATGGFTGVAGGCTGVTVDGKVGGRVEAPAIGTSPGNVTVPAGVLVPGAVPDGGVADGGVTMGGKGGTS
jgi:hypothetical protein